MRFGSCERFAIEIQPVHPSWQHVSPDDRGPWAEVTIWAGGKPLTQHQMPGEDRLRNGVYLPLLPLARWFRAAWWPIGWEQRAPGFPSGVWLPTDFKEWGEVILATEDDDAADRRDGWWERHFLPAADTGAWLPLVTFVRVEDDLWITWQPHTPAGHPAPTFLQAAGTYAVRWEEASRVVDEFCRTVSDRVAASKHGLEPDLSTRPPGAEEMLAWLTGAPEALLPAITHQLLKMAPEMVGLDDIQASVGLQAARDVVWDDAVLAILAELERVTAQPGKPDGKLAAAREISLLNDHWSLPEKEGTQAARALRERLRLGSEPLTDVVAWLDEAFGVQTEHRRWPGSDNQMVAGERQGASPVILTIESERPKKDWEKKAEAVRGLGHLLLDAPTSRGVRGAAFSPMVEGPRKRRAGAFMAEMLLPTAALETRFKGHLQRTAKRDAFKQLMDDYGVGARLAAWHLYNQRYLPSKEAVQELIDDFASV